MEMSIEGLESLMAKLRRLGGSVDEAIDKGIGKGVQKIKSDAKVNCPYDTGRLKGSISTEHLELKVWAVGTNVEYAMFVEFGTGQHGAPGVPHTMQPWRYKDAKGKYHAFRQLYNATDKLVYAGQEDSAVSLYGKTVSISGTNSITSNKSITVSSDARVKNHISDLPARKICLIICPESHFSTTATLLPQGITDLSRKMFYRHCKNVDCPQMILQVSAI